MGFWGMDTHAVLSLVAGAVHLALALLVLVQRAGSPLALPIALLSLNMFGWNAADFGADVSGNDKWRELSDILSPFSPALGFHVIVAFVAQERAKRWALIASYGFFATLSLAAFFDASRDRWGLTFTVGELVVSGAAIGILIHHARTVTDATERSRAIAILGAFAVAALLAVPDLMYPVLGFPRVANVGTLGATVVVTFVAMRWRLLGRDVSVRAVLYALLLSGLALFGALALFQSMGVGVGRALEAAGALALMMAVLAATRAVVTARTEYRERLKHLATLGRFSSQMAHDLRTPLATLKGALQFFSEERACGRSLDAHGEFIDVMLEQVDRLQSTVGEYERIGRVEPRRVSLDLNDLIHSILAMHGFTATPRVRVCGDLAEDLPRCEADRDLIANAVENLVKNAIEAMPSGGIVTVRTARSGADGIVVSVEDTGHGMDARQMETAFEDFYTTKVGGSGLGLAFVRRVVRAHGGQVSLKARLGGGTVVRMHLPLSAA